MPVYPTVSLCLPHGVPYTFWSFAINEILVNIDYSKLPLLRPSLVLPKSGLINGVVLIITKTCRFKYIENFTSKKMKIFR